jgi:hypothetical protein
MTDLIADFEAEHIFAHSLWDDPDIGPFLQSNGYQRNMLGNLLGLYSDAGTVAQIQALPDGHPLKEALLSQESMFGINRHKGNAPGGNQFGKNSFRFRQVQALAGPQRRRSLGGCGDHHPGKLEHRQPLPCRNGRSRRNDRNRDMPRFDYFA